MGEKLTYKNLSKRYGSLVAFDLLLRLEKLAHIRNDICNFDEDSRLQRAIAALDEVNYIAPIDTYAMGQSLYI